MSSISTDLSLVGDLANEAYRHSLQFKKLKEGGKAQEVSTNLVLEAEAPEAPPAEKPKPNTIPFKPGFLFEYFGEGGKISISVTAREHIRVAQNGGDMPDPRKKTLRSLVMLALNKLDAPAWNSWREGEGVAPEAVKKELSEMGIKPELPFGLGERSFLMDEGNALKAYTPLDVKG